MLYFFMFTRHFADVLSSTIACVFNGNWPFNVLHVHVHVCAPKLTPIPNMH